MNSILKVLMGTWFICSTNFPMWTKGQKNQPTFCYTLVKEKDKYKLLDEVKYFKKGKTKSIKGVDYQDTYDTMSFVWRGKGLLRPLKSKWKIVKMAPDAQWVVIYFSKTMFTPEGLDIISRSPDLSKETIDFVKSELTKDSVLKRQVPSLKNLYK